MNKINESVLICGVVKNVGNGLLMNMNQAIETGEMFQDYRILIYENNSTDNTKEILQKYSLHPKIVIQSEDLDLKTKSNFKLWAYTEITGSNHACRMELISNARNKLVDEMNREKYDDFGYVIWVDLDSNGWELNGILDSFQKKEEWDVVYANNPNHYYDMYAYRGTNHLFGPEIIGELFWINMPRFQIPKSETLISVYSAFGGLGIYKKSVFQKHRFDFIVNDTIQEVYQSILEKYPYSKEIISKEDGKFPGGQYDEKTGIYWKSNSGYNGPVVCEHVGLNFALIQSGYRLFINPNIMYYRGA
jgi:hypothetical protein